MPGGDGTGPMGGRGPLLRRADFGVSSPYEMLQYPRTPRISRSYTVSSPSVGSPASGFGERDSSG